MKSKAEIFGEKHSSEIVRDNIDKMLPELDATKRAMITQEGITDEVIYAMLKGYNADNLCKDVIRAKCLDCCAFEKPEVSKCETKTCVLWKFRPYQKK